LKSLFIGKVNNDLIFPYPKMKNDDIETVNMLIDSIDKFAKESIISSEIDEQANIPKIIVDQFKELGLFGLIIPEEYEGFGFTQSMYNRIMEKLSSTDSSCSLLIGAHMSIGMKAILLFGNEDQKKKYLPKLASGEYIAAYALTEPGSGSDAQSIQTKAELSVDKSHYILNGSKIWITNGGIADLFTVYAQTGAGISSFIVTRDMGVQSGKPEKKMGIRGSNTTTLFFENVKVPAENRIGDENKGFKVAMEVLNQGRLGLSAGCLGAAKEALKLALGHSKKREQFNEPIIHFELIQEKLSRMAVSNFIMESMIYLTSHLCDTKKVDFSLESAICKIYSTESLWQTVNDALQIAGGLGFMQEYPYERMVRDARINMIFEGSNEIMRAFIALQGAKSVGNELMAGKLDEIKENKAELKEVHPLLKDAEEAFDDGSRLLKEAAINSVMEYQFDIVKKEFVQERITSMAVSLYGLVAGISRCESIIKELGEEKSEYWLSLLKIFTEDAKKQIKESFSKLKDPLDSVKNNIVKTLAENETLLN
ncbi:MAG: acyl-CoA dehydrogenase family protein, partial [Spirochaetota bacterium]|nr:acyl-CoA dehydrogenase family protein [Spirochaetota bacterium]